MYQGKHVTHKKKKHLRKTFILLVSVAVLLCGVVGGSLAYLIAEDAPVENVFNPGSVSCQVNETSFNGDTKTGVTIQNTSPNTSAYIRAAIVVTWKNSSGEVYGKMPAQGTDYTLDLGNGWKPSGGFYCYGEAVDPGESTSALINACTDLDTAPEGYGLCVEIVADAIQSNPVSAVQEAWGFVPGT